MNLSAEQSVIGGLVLFPNETQEAYHVVSADDFSSDALRVLYETCELIHSQGKTVDSVTVISRVDAAYKPCLVECCEIMPSFSGFWEYVAIVREQAQKRRLGSALTQMGIDCTSPSVALSDVTGRLYKLTQEQIEHDRASQDATAKDFSGSFAEFLTKLAQPDTALKTGWKLFDSVTGGLQRTALYAVSGRPGQGKTDFSLNLAGALSKRYRVCYCSMEMPRVQLMSRIASKATRINGGRLRDRKISEEERQEIEQAMHKIEQHTQLVLDEGQGLDVAAVESKIIRHKPDVLFIDHLELMCHDKAKRNRWEAIAETTRMLKVLALRHSIVLVLLVQQGREADKRKGNATLSELRGGASVEADSDGVMFLTSANTQDRLTGDTYKEAKVLISKNRYGAQGDSLPFHWFPQYSLWIPTDTREEALKCRPF